MFLKQELEWKGKSEELKETSNELFIIFALALLTAFLVMAANFNSFIHPAIIMLTVPLSVLGGIVFILLFNSSINIFLTNSTSHLNWHLYQEFNFNS